MVFEIVTNVTDFKPNSSTKQFQSDPQFCAYYSSASKAVAPGQQLTINLALAS